MNKIYESAMTQLVRRARQCFFASKHNGMADCGWSDKRSEAYWLKEHYTAVYKAEKIVQRMARRKP